MHVHVYQLPYLDLRILRSSEDGVMQDCYGLDRSLMALEGHDRKHVLQVPNLKN